MSAPLKCPACGAPYNAPVAKWLDYVNCAYCGTSIPIPRTPQTIVVSQNTAGTSGIRRFELETFGDFLKRKKGISTFDAVSGTLLMGPTSVVVNPQGMVSGDPRLKRRVEDWIYEFLST